MVGIDLDANSFAEIYVECVLLHITSVEDIQTQPA